MEKNIKELLEKHISGTIDVEERKYLKKSLSGVLHSDLSNILSDIWSNYHDRIWFDDDFDQFIEKLQIPTEERKPVHFLFRIGKIAASILIPLILGFSIYFYRENKSLSNFMGTTTSINISSGEKTQIVLPDGTLVSLNSATTLSYPSDFGLNKRNITLSGEAYLEVAKNENIPFCVNTDMISVEVLGTKFNINAYNNSDIVETSLLEGSVKITTRGKNSRSVILSPHEKAIYLKSRDLLSVSQTNTHFETAWLRGEMVFRSARFSEIIDKLKKRYGVEIEVNGKGYDEELFTGSFKEDYIINVLKILQNHYSFTYEEVNGKIQVHFN